VVETLTRRKVDLCVIQEHRWASGLTANQARLIKGKDSVYKFYWSANDMGLGGVGFLLADQWLEKVFDVQHISDRIIQIRLILGKVIFTFLSIYAPQVGRTEAEKQHFYDQLQVSVNRIPASEVLFPLGDRNGHVGAESSGYEDAHGGRGFGIRNPEGERVLEFAVANDLVVGNTHFIKRPSHLITYCSGTHMTQIDYILYKKRLCSAVKDVKVIPAEECAQQHHIVVCDLMVKLPKKKKRKFVPRTNVSAPGN